MSYDNTQYCYLVKEDRELLAVCETRRMAEQILLEAKGGGERNKFYHVEMFAMNRLHGFQTFSQYL